MLRKTHSKLRPFAQKIAIFLSVLVVIFTTTPVFAISESKWDFFDLNHIFWHDPDGESCTTSSSPVSGNTLYDGRAILEPVALKRLQENQPFYKKSASKYNIPWQVIATLHYREASANRYNPGNGQGAYQLYSYTAGGTNANRFEPGTISDAEFQRQTDIVAGLIKNNYGTGLNLNTDDGIKTLFFRFNGVASAYISQARSLGYNEAEASRGEGSPYVMNLADSQRDSSQNKNWKQILTDGGPMQTANQVPGAFLIFSSLGGSTGINSCTAGSSHSGDINATALELAWPDTGHGLTAKPEYKSALQSTGFAGYGAYYVAIGASCDVFVATVMRASGADPNFACCGVSNNGTTYSYVTNSGKYQEVPNTAASLKPGDIRIKTGAQGHIELYVEVNGVGKIASASYGQRTGEISNFYDNSATYKAYRLIK